MKQRELPATLEALVNRHGLCIAKDSDLYRSHLVGWMLKAYEAALASPEVQALREDAPWCDLKVAFGCDDDEALWKAVESEKIHFPKGWKLIETDGSCARVVAIFRVDRIPTVADGESVREAIDAAMEKQNHD